MAKKSNGKGKGTALATIEPANYPALNPDSDIAEAMLANSAGGQLTEADLIRVPTPAGGAVKWMIPGDSGVEVADALVGILVYFAPRGVLWPTEELGTSPPLLVTNDLVVATREGPDYGDIDPDELEKYRTNDSDPATYDWMSLPWNQWGTGKNGNGKRCKESRILMLLREGEAFPVLVRAQPGSLKPVRPFILRLPVPHWRAVVSLGLKEATSKGDATGRGKVQYSQIVPTFVGQLDKETGERIRKLYTEPLRAMTAGTLASDRDD